MISFRGSCILAKNSENMWNKNSVLQDTQTKCKYKDLGSKSLIAETVNYIVQGKGSSVLLKQCSSHLVKMNSF